VNSSPQRALTSSSCLFIPRAPPCESSSCSLMEEKRLDDFHWSHTEEPHATRRKEILEKHPEIKELYGVDPNTKYRVAFVVLSQILISYLLRNTSVITILLISWVIGGGINHFLTLAVHEITHNLAFEKPLHNRLFSICVANLPIAFPETITFQKYHMDHHLYQGVDGIDMDIPTKAEGMIFRSTFMKCIWVLFQPYFYIFRPLWINPKPVGLWELYNCIIQFTFDFLIFYFFGWKSLLYLVASTISGLGLHPMAGHFIAEHYVFVDTYETYSYYGPLNALALNVGYHNEHHDFPRIPGSRLPKVRELAPEYYDALPAYTSWIVVVWYYITKLPIGPFSRVKRKKKTL